MATRMQQRRGTAEQWTTANPVLGAGEIGFETDTGKFKVGDNVNTWTNLSYFLNADDLDGALGDYATEAYVGQAISSLVDGAPDLLNTLNELAAAMGDDASFTTTIFNATEQAKEDALAEAQTYMDTAIENLSGTIATTTSQIEESVDDLTTEVGTISETVSGNSSAIDSLETASDGHSTAIGTINDALLLKAPLANPTFTGTVALPTTTSVGDVSSAELGHLNGVTSAIQTQLDAKAPTANPTFTGTVAGVTKAMVGLGDVDNTTDAAKPVSTATQTALDLKAPLADPTFTGTVSGVTKSHVGLANVDNTADADKPVSSATQTALDAKASLAGATFTGNVEVDGNMIVDGDFTVNGTNFAASATSITIEDNMLQLSHQNAANTVDLGLVVGYNDGAAKHAGIVRDVSDDSWKLFKGVSTEPATTVAFGEGSLDNLELNNVKVAGVVFTDGTQTKVGVPSLTEFVEKTANYTLDDLDLRDGIVEMNSSSATTFTVPLNATLAWPVGASMDILGTGTGEVTIAGVEGVTINSTPGLKLRTRWSSATILKRAENSWIAYGDLKA
jgi:hypothetical protein